VLFRSVSLKATVTNEMEAPIVVHRALMRSNLLYSETNSRTKSCSTTADVPVRKESPLKIVQASQAPSTLLSFVNVTSRSSNCLNADSQFITRVYASNAIEKERAKSTSTTMQSVTPVCHKAVFLTPNKTVAETFSLRQRVTSNLVTDRSGVRLNSGAGAVSKTLQFSSIANNPLMKPSNRLSVGASVETKTQVAAAAAAEVKRYNMFDQNVTWSVSHIRKQYEKMKQSETQSSNSSVNTQQQVTVDSDSIRV